jgi:enoyl-CoA hydratase/carnithine racemase
MRYLTVEQDSTVARITLHHPGGNRINFAMRSELVEAMERVGAGGARVLVVGAEGADFCLGGDIREWPGIPSAELRPKVGVFAEVLDRLKDLPIPTIAAVQGACFGGGFELALSCDMIVAERSARFAFPESRLGILTLQGGVVQLAERVGQAKALELVMLGEPVGAEQLASWNVVNRVADDGELALRVDELAERLARGPADAYAATKELIRVWQRSGSAGVRAALYDLSMPLFDTADVQTALRAAAEAAEAGTSVPVATFAHPAVKHNH